MPIQGMLAAHLQGDAFWSPGSCQDHALGLIPDSPLPPSRVGVDTGRPAGPALRSLWCPQTLEIQLRFPSRRMVRELFLLSGLQGLLCKNGGKS